MVFTHALRYNFNTSVIEKGDNVEKTYSKNGALAT